MTDIVIDTCVFVAAVRSQRGASYQLLNQIGSGRFDFHISIPIVLEYEEVIKGIHEAVGLETSDGDDIIDFLCANGRRHRVHYLWRPFLKDPDDDMILELAVAAGVGTIVTFNHRDFEGADQFGVKTVSPGLFLRLLGGKK